jgi:RNA polymerase sigma-70 factor (ECF subfamily)
MLAVPTESSLPGDGDRLSSGLDSTFELIARARVGDQAALDRLFQLHFRPLRRWASGRLPKWARDLADTDDLVQETLIQTFKRLDAFEPRRVGALQAYLRQAVLNRIRSEIRRHGREPAIGEIGEQQAGDAESPLEAAIGREAVARYERALATLRVEEREAIIGRVEMGYTYQELADALGKPSAEAARKAAERALVRLAEAMSRETSG